MLRRQHAVLHRNDRFVVADPRDVLCGARRDNGALDLICLRQVHGHGRDRKLERFRSFAKSARGQPDQQAGQQKRRISTRFMNEKPSA